MRARRWLGAASALAIGALSVAAISATSGGTDSADPVEHASSADVLSLLPEGPEKRAFFLDCTGCHQMDRARAFPNGRARSAEEWSAITARMLSYAGATTAFPVISAARDPDATGAWLAAHWSSPTAPRPRPVEATPIEIREYDWPHPQDLPHDLAVDAEGRVVATGMFTHRMLRLDPASGEYEAFEIPVPEANPRAIEIAPNGDWWVLLGGPMQVARYRPSTDEWDAFDVGVYGHSVRVDPAGRVWYNGHFTKDPEIVGYVDPSTGERTTYEVPNTPELRAGGGPMPYGLRIGPDGRVWGTELLGNRLFVLDPEAGFRVWTLPTVHSGPRRLDVAPDGTVWIPAYAANALVRFDPETEVFEEHTLPFADALPYIARVHPSSGKVWVSTSAADAVFVFDPETAAWTTHLLPSAGALVRHIDIDPRTGAVWAAYGAAPGIPPKLARIGP